MPKSFKDIIKETVNPPKSEDEQRFLDKHEVETTDHPVKNEKQFVSDKKKDKSRGADNQSGEDADVYEETMSDAQMKKREEIVKSMKKKMSSFKDKYGDRAKDVMYATATKMAMKEEAEEEVEMMTRQLEFIAYAAEEIMEYLEMGVDPEEWFQNKLASVHDRMTSLHAYIEGDKRMNGAMMGMSPFGEEVELDESVSVGKMKLKDGTNVTISKSDAEVLNSVMKELNPSNHKEMMKRMSASKEGFDEILKFAKAAQE